MGLKMLFDYLDTRASLNGQIKHNVPKLLDRSEQEIVDPMKDRLRGRRTLDKVLSAVLIAQKTVD